MPERGHLQLLLPVVSAITERGVAASVWTDRRFEAEVVAAGAEFVDLFDGFPLEEADAESSPVPCRYVTFAGIHAERIRRELEERGATLIVYETFAVIGWVVGGCSASPTSTSAPVTTWTRPGSCRSSRPIRGLRSRPTASAPWRRSGIGTGSATSPRSPTCPR